MYTHYNTSTSRAAGSISHFPDAATVASPMHYSTTIPPQLNSEMSCNININNNNNGCSSGGSGSSSYAGSPSSMASYEATTPHLHLHHHPGLMQRSVSSHSLQKTNNNNNGGVHHQHQHPFSAFFVELLEDDGPVRRVCSTGDLQRINAMQHYHHSDSPLSSESSMIIEGMSRATPYSPEEKKERIERYRSKRNQRNFNKKIKYACRKTLADSRPRIRGRFARNDEIVINPPVEWINGAGEEEDEEDEKWENYFNSIAPANLDQEPHCSIFY
ncbi:hypothetical protein RIF29_31965 [Crotalaria pallida]|uniref:CCT domain-containing protein n=1 Tax=Crotalaria pallida TaxID=3830 RepID=A0AAN9HXG0_CROPI